MIIDFNRFFILFRKHRIWCHHDHIDIPGGIIEGPNLELENKEFIAVLTVNNKEKVFFWWPSVNF